MVAASAVAFSALFAWALVSQHRAFHSNAFDLGFFDQIVWNTSQGRWFENSFVSYNFLGQHVEPVLLLYALVYGALPAVELLLVTQAVAAAAAAVPLYVLARHWLQHATAAALLALAYLVSPALHRAVTFDFHPEVMGPGLLFGAAALAVKGRVAASLLPFAALFLLKEEAAIAGAGFAWLLWVLGHRRLGVLTLLGSAAYFLGAAALMSEVRGGVPGDLQDRYGYLGSDIGSLVVGLATRPDLALERLLSADVTGGLALLLGQAVGLPLASPLALGAAPLTLAHMLSLHPEQGRLALHYAILPHALFTIAGVDAIRRLALAAARRWGQGRVAPVLAGWALLASLAGAAAASPFGLGFDARRYQDSERSQAVRSVLAQVPPDVPVSAQGGLVPHLSQRPVIFEFPGINEARVVVVDRKGWASTYSQAAGYDAVLASLPSRGFRLMTEIDGFEMYCLEGRCE